MADDSGATGQPNNTGLDQSKSSDDLKSPVTPEPGATPPADDKPIEYKFTLPDGLQLDEEILNQFTVEAQALKLPADKAQALVDMGTKSVQKVMDAVLEADKARRAGWAAEAEADPEFGGPKLKENLAIAKSAIEKLSPKLKGFLDETGLGNHPQMIRFAFKVGQMLKQDGFLTSNPGRDPEGKKKDHAKTLYPDLK